MLVTNYTSGVVTAFIENSLNNQSHHFVDKIGGISSVVPLFLSAVDYYWNHTVSQLNRRVPPYAFASLEQLLCDALTLVNSHHFRDHVDIPSSVCYLTSAIHWVLGKTRVHILERLPQDFNNGYLAPRTYIQSYVKFITTSLSHPRYYLVWNDLDMRVMKTLRSGLPSDYDPLSKLSGVFSLLANCLTFNSEWFPTILRKTMKLRSLPTLPVYQPIWDAFDNNLHAFQLSLKGAMMIAEQYDSCRTCRQKSRTRTAWAEGHRYLCKLLRLSGGTHPLFRTDDSVGLSYVATLELLWRRMCELPLVCLTIPRQSSNVQLERKRFQDFPGIFSGEEWSTTLVPQLKKHIDAREIPSFLSFAQRAATGSSSSIRALHNHLSAIQSRLTWKERLLVAPVLLISLEPNAIPDTTPSQDPSTTQSITDAIISLNSLAHLRLFDLKDAHLTSATDFYLRHQGIFLWSLFLQKHFFYPEQISESEPLDSSNLMVFNNIWAVAQFIKNVSNDVDFSSYPLILETFYQAWKKYIGIDVYQSDLGILQLASKLNSLMYTHLSKSLFGKTQHDVVSRMDGPSTIVAYYLALVENITDQMKSNHTRPAYGDLLLQQTLFNFIHILQFNSFRDGVALKFTIRKLTSILKWLIEDLERFPPAQRNSLPRNADTLSVPNVRVSGVVVAYYDLIARCYYTGGYYPAMDILRLGIVEKLRTGLHEHVVSPDLWDEEYLKSFDSFVCMLAQEGSVFPRMRRYMRPILHLPSNTHHESSWRTFDNLYDHSVEPFAQAKDMADTLFTFCARPLCQQKPEHGIKLKLCSACRVSRYCSIECQKIDWNQGHHRSLCLLFQLSGSTHPFIRTNDATGIGYLAQYENFWRAANNYHTRAHTALSTHRSQSASTNFSTCDLFVIQTTMFETSPIVHFQVKDLADFPHLFGNESWTQIIEPRLRKFMAKRKIPEYLCVFSLPLIGTHLDLFSPLQAIIVSGMLSERVKRANGEDSQRAALSSVSQPLKSAALRSSLGSLIGIKALLTHLRTYPVASEECLPIAPTILPGLSLNQIPPIPTSDPSVQQAIQCAALSLSNLSHLVNSSAPRNSEDRIPELIPLSKFFITHRAKIFPWLSFIQRHYFHPGLNPKPLYPPIPEMSDFLMLHAVAGFIKLIDRTTFKVDYTPYEEIVDMVLELWQKCLLVDYDETNPFELRLAQDVTCIVCDLLKRSRPTVDKLGGPAGVAALFLCWMEKNHRMIKASKTKPPRAYMLFIKSIERSLGVFSQDHLAEDLEPQFVVRVTKIFQWLLKDRSRVIAKEGRASEIILGIDSVVLVFSAFIVCYPPKQDFNPFLHILRTGIYKDIRTGLPNFDIIADPPVPTEEALFGIIRLLTTRAGLFDSFAKHSKSLLHLPGNGTHSNDWTFFDNVVGRSLQARKGLPASAASTPSGELPVISIGLDAESDEEEVEVLRNSYRDFPQIFGEDAHTFLAPRLKEFMKARVIPEFLVVVYLPFGENPIPVLSPLHTLAMAGIKAVEEWVINGESDAKMNSSQRAALSAVSQPLRSAALKSSLGSLIGIRALSTSLRTHPIASEDCLPIAPTILPGLSLNQIPPIPTSDPSVQQAIQCAAWSLSNLSQLVNSSAPRNSEDRIPELIPLAKFFITHRAKIFPWLSFIQRHYFHHGLNPKPLYPPIPEMSDFLMLHAVAGFIKLIDRTAFQVDYTPYQEVVDVVLELWQMCFLVDYDDANPFELRLAQDTTRIVFDLLKRSLDKRSLQIVDRLGGPSGVTALFLCWMEKNYRMIKASTTKPLRAYMLLIKSLEQSLGIFCREPFLGQVEPQVVVRVTKIFQWLINDRSRVLAKEGRGSVLFLGIDSVVLVYSVFVLCYPPTSDFHALLHLLRLGVFEALRTGLPNFNVDSANAPVPSGEALFGTIKVLTTCAALYYPFAKLKRTKSLLHLPSNGVHSEDWTHFDNVVGPVLQSFDFALGSSNPLDRCSMCNLHHDILRVCSDCRVALYCSAECQKADWKRDHKFICQLFCLSGSSNFLIRTNNAKGLLYLAHQEMVWRLTHDFLNNARRGLASSSAETPQGEIPVITFGLDTELRESEVIHHSYRDFPEIFGEDARTSLIPRLKTFMNARVIPEFLVVVYLPIGDGGIPVLSPLHTLAIAGIKPVEEWVIAGRSETLYP
ncbi:hypothetical protein ONZ45_g15557 [Pleurotus djamor]|nr:hypothetical protein ONZ45_g15557 [Pleurotus djamor]